MPKKRRQRNRKDLTGLRFFRLVVVGRAGSDKEHSRWLCLCDCGNYTIVNSSNLRQTVSCGCYKREVHAITLANQARSGTGPERIFAGALRGFGISFDEQYWPTKNQKSSGGPRQDYYSDFRIKNTNIIVEVDGCYYHNCSECGMENSFPGKTEDDLVRHDNIEALGFKIYHFWEHQVKADAGSCVKALPIVWFS